MMSAKEMFENLGFNTCEEEEFRDYFGTLIRKEIKYSIDAETIYDKYFGYIIRFITETNNHYVVVRGAGNYDLIDMPILQAINKQVEELGWLDVKN